MIKDLQISRAEKLINNFKNISVLVVGDLMLDEFIWGAVSRISPEAPVPVVHVETESFMPGGSCNVAHNIKALGGNVYLAGIVGKDEKGRLLIEDLDRRGIDTSGVIFDSKRRTTIKTRVIAHNQQVVRIDRETASDIDDSTVNDIMAFTKRAIKKVDAIIIEDYGKGVVVSKLISNLIKMVHRDKKIITIDPKENHFKFYKNATAITPNHLEAAKAVDIKVGEDGFIEKIGRKLISQLKCEVLLMTLGESGMCVFQKNGAITKIPTVAQDVYDVSGAGDTVISAYTLSVAAGAKCIEAANIANCAAGIVVGKIGIAVANQGELIRKVKKEIGKKRIQI